MHTYMLQPKNYTNQRYFTNYASLKNFILTIHDAIHLQLSENIELYIGLENYMALFYAPLYFTIKEFIVLTSRSPPAIGY